MICNISYILFFLLILSHLDPISKHPLHISTLELIHFVASVTNTISSTNNMHYGLHAKYTKFIRH